MAATGECWREKVREKLVDVFANNPEDLYRILFYLEEEDNAYKDNMDRPYAPHWKSLKAMLKADEAFRDFAMRLSEETRKAGIDQDYRNRINKFREEIETYCDDINAMKDIRDIRDDKLCTFDVKPAAFINRIKVVLSSNNTGMMITAVDDVLSFLEKPTGIFVMKGLAAVYLFCRFSINISRWGTCEISWKRCAKNILDLTLTAMAGMLGGNGGAVLGILVGSLSAVVGGIAGGLVFAVGVAYLSDYFTQMLFGIPQDVALENAYRCLGVRMTASNDEVSNAFRKQCLIHYPDIGGKKKDMLKSSMATIRLARKKNDGLKCD